MAFELEVASVSSRVPEVAIRCFCVPKLSWSETCLWPYDARGAHRYSIWPPVPIIIKDIAIWRKPDDYDFDAAIVHHSRVCELYLLGLSIFQLQRLVSATQ